MRPPAIAEDTAASRADDVENDEHQEYGSEPPAKKGNTRGRTASSRTILRAALISALLGFGAAAVGVGYKKVGALKISGGALLETQSLQHYKNELRLSASELQQAWDGASQTVRNVFGASYMPRVQGQPPPTDPLSMFQERVKELRATAPLEKASEQEKQKYILQLRIATVILRAASSRLASLKELDDFLVQKNMGTELALERTPIPPREELLKQKDDLLSFSQFVDMLGQGRVDISAVGNVKDKKIPRSLAESLANYLQAVDLQAKHDEEAYRILRKLLDATGTVLPSGHLQELNELAENERIFAGDERPLFPSSFFACLMSGFEKMRRAESIPANNIATWANDWTVKGALDRLMELETQVLYLGSSSVSAKLTAVERWAKADSTKPPVYDDFGAMALGLL